MSDATLTAPPGWSTTTLGEVASLITKGATPTTYGHSYADAGALFVRVENLAGGWVDRGSRPVFIDEHVHAALARSQLVAGDILFSIAGTIGRTAVVRARDLPANTNQALAIVRGTDRVLSPSYLRWWLAAGAVQAAAQQGARGGAMSNISLEDVRRISVRVAPRAEQDRIVAAIEQRLSDVDAGVAALERVLANLKRYRAAVLKAACEGRLVPTEAELARKERRTYEAASVLLGRILEERRARWVASGKSKAKYVEPAAPDAERLAELPEGWLWTTVEQLASMVTDGDHNPPPRVSAGVPHLTARNIKRGRLVFDGCSYVTEQGFAQTRGRYEPLAGDVIITCVGTIGGTAVVPKGAVFSADRNLAGIRLAHRAILPAYVRIVLDSPEHQKVLRGASGSTAQPHLYLGDLRALAVPVPPAEEQVCIVAEVERLLSVAEEVEQTVRAQLARAARLRQSVLKRAFEGKLVPQDPSDEPASLMLAKVRTCAAQVEKARPTPRRRPRTVLSEPEAREPR